MKRILFSLLIVLLLGLVLAAGICAEDADLPVPGAEESSEGSDVKEVKENGFTFQIKDGEATLVRMLSVDEYAVFIPEEVQGCPVTRISSYISVQSPTESYNDSANRFSGLVVPASVKRIDSNAFWDCNELQNVYLCEGVEYVGDYAFGDDVVLTLPDSLLAIGEGESYGEYDRRPRVYASEGSVGHEYAQRIGAKFYSNRTSGGTMTGFYANMQFVVKNGEATLLDCVGIIDPFLPAYIDTYPVTCLGSGFYTFLSQRYLVLPPTLTSMAPDWIGDYGPEALTLVYYPGTPAEELVKDFHFPYMSIYEALAVPFDDVPTDSWYYGAVSFAYHNRLMDGVSSVKFDPHATMTRAMLVTVLWRLDGGHAAGPSPFTDVPNGSWYTEAVLWAAENGVVNGVGNGKFNPNGTVTREQIAAILCRYAELCGVDVSADASLTYFPDGSQVSSYAVGPMKWAVKTGLIGGRKNGNTLYLVPHDGATRAEVAAILMRFLT